MDLNRPPKLRTSGRGGAKKGAGEGELRSAFPVNEVAELVADLVESTGLIGADKLALVRGRAKQGMPFSQAMLDEDVATSEGIARALASRFQLPFVDLPLVGVQEEAVKEFPIHVLERVEAVPYALDDNVLRIAVADPGNVQAIDELRLATKYQLELAVAPAKTSRPRCAASSVLPRPSAPGQRLSRSRTRSTRKLRRPTTSRSTTGSPKSRSSGS